MTGPHSLDMLAPIAGFVTFYCLTRHDRLRDVVYDTFPTASFGRHGCFVFVSEADFAMIKLAAA